MGARLSMYTRLESQTAVMNIQSDKYTDLTAGAFETQGTNSEFSARTIEHESLNDDLKCTANGAIRRRVLVGKEFEGGSQGQMYRHSNRLYYNQISLQRHDSEFGPLTQVPSTLIKPESS